MAPLYQTLLYYKAPILRAEGPKGGGMWLYPTPMPSCDYKHTHSHTVDVSWPTSLPFFSVALFLWHLCAQFFIIRQSGEAAQISEKKHVPQCLNVSPLLWHFITSSKLYTPHNTHRHIHQNTGSTENKQEGAHESFATCRVCLHV